MNKKFLSLFLISIFLLSSCSTVLADDDKYYTIDLADFFIKVDDNGLLKVNESIKYTFHGQYNGVYRDIPLKEGQSIENLEVTADGAYTKVEQYGTYENYRIKVYLYSDEDLTQPIKDTSVVIHYNYDFTKVVNIYNDVGELHYKIWGDNWDVEAGKIMAHIEFPQDKQVQYWINPYNAKTHESWDGNILNIETDGSWDDYLEFRGIIPLSEFNDPIYANKINSDGYDKLVKIQEDYKNEEELKSAMVVLIPILFIFSLIIPVYFYYRFGREPKITYDVPYEHEIPTSNDPIFVDAMFSTKSDVGKVTNNGIQATIMDLINKNVIKLATNENGDKTLRLILPENCSNLQPYQQNIVNLLLRPYATGNVLDFKEMKRKLRREYEAKRFNRNLKTIKRDYENMEVKPILRQYFSVVGSVGFKIYGICLAIGAILVGIWALFFLLSGPLLMESIVFLIIGIIMLVLPNRIGGSWTEEGLLRFKKWKAFKKFIKDFSLIKQHPPESIAIWDKYLVYATALGDAKEVSKAMKTIGPAAEVGHYSDVYYYSHFGGPALFSSIITTSVAAANPSSSHGSGGSGGFGGAGGGSGGGGGGAF